VVVEALSASARHYSAAGRAVNMQGGISGVRLAAARPVVYVIPRLAGHLRRGAGVVERGGLEILIPLYLSVLSSALQSGKQLFDEQIPKFNVGWDWLLTIGL